jgi:hypothetical protein
VLLACLAARLGVARARYQRLMRTSEGVAELEATVLQGATTARSVAKTTLARCYDAVGMDNAARRLRG